MSTTVASDSLVVPNNNVVDSLSNIESRIVSQPSREIGVILDSENGDILRIRKSPYQNGGVVRFDPELDFPLMNNNIITHNHPSGATFSPDDISTALGSGAKEIRAVTNEGTHSLSFGSGAEQYLGNKYGAAGFVETQKSAAISQLKAEFQSGVRTIPSGLSKQEMEVFNSQIILDQMLNNTDWLNYKFIPKK